MSSIEDLIKKLKKKRPELKVLSEISTGTYLSTGVFSLDAILGGGLPHGAITLLHGDSATGKSLIASQTVAMAQKAGYLCVWFDTEGAQLTKDMMVAAGVDAEKLVFYSLNTIEEIFNEVDNLIDFKDIEQNMLVVWDTIAGASIQLEMDSDVGKAMVGRHALYMSQGLRKLSSKVRNTNVCCLLLNQLRTNIGVMYGNKDTSPGGKALEFYPSTIIKLRMSKSIKSNNKRIGAETVARIDKSRNTAPFKECVLPIYYGERVSNSLASYYHLLNEGLIEKAGAWKKITLGGVEHKFNKVASFSPIFEQNQAEIKELILNSYVVDKEEVEDTE